MNKYGLPVTIDRGPTTWINQTNGICAGIAKQMGHVELATYASTINQVGKRGYPVALHVPLVTLGSGIAPGSFELLEPLPQVAYATTSEATAFLGILADPVPGDGHPVRVLTHGHLMEYTHGFAHMTPAYLPTTAGPLTDVNTGFQVGYFTIGNATGADENTGIWLTQ